MWIDDEYLTDAAIDLDYLSKRWTSGSRFDKLVRLIRTIKRADSFRFCSSPETDPDVVSACEQLGVPVLTARCSADLCASVLKTGGFVVSGDMRLYPYLVDNGTMFQPKRYGWELYRLADWRYQYALEPEHWTAFLELIDQGTSLHRARKAAKRRQSPCQLNPTSAPSCRLSAETMGMILELEQITNDALGSI